jgi:hypothetical protein
MSSATSVASPQAGVSALAKSVLASLFLVLLAAFIVVVDLGVNAGKIHYGVSVGDIGLGGLTQSEAVKRLSGASGSDPLAQRMKSTPVTFTRGPLVLSVVPGRVGWSARAADTGARAMKVGRAHGLWDSAYERARAWFGGVAVAWAGRPSPRRVGFLLNHWERRVERAGYTMSDADRAKLRYKVRRAMSTWPRDHSYRIPVSGS